MRLFASALPILFALTVAPVAAQEPGVPRAGSTAPGQGREEQGREKPADPRRASLEDLYDRLAKAGDENESKGIAALIERRWSRSGSDTADLLMSRAAEAADGKDYPLAVELLDRVLALEPGWAEAWYRRANVFYLLDDPVGAMADLRRTLELEPRHFGAWTGLGHILMSSDDKPHALDAYRRALKIYPQLSVVQTLVERLTPQVEGQDL